MPDTLVPDDFQSYPTNRFMGIVEAPDEADRVVAGLHALGLGAGLWALTGHDVTHVLDPDGQEHGLWARLVRVVQKVGYEAGQLAEYADAAQAGAWVLSVQLAADAEHKDAVRDLFARHGGRNLRYFGALGIEDVLLNAPVTAGSVSAAGDAVLARDEAAATAVLAKGGVVEQTAKAEMVAEGAPVVAGTSGA